MLNNCSCCNQLTAAVSHFCLFNDTLFFYMTLCKQDLNAGLVANVGALRDQYQADLVQLIIESGEYCGFGNVMQSATTAFAVSSTEL
jgi:hypothetical protein